MRYEKRDGSTYIYADENEREYEVLFSIVRASFALARPVEEGWKLFDIGTRFETLNDEQAAQFIDWGKYRKGQGAVISMDEIGGRKCSTFIAYVREKQFVLDNETYEAFRGLPDTMLEVAKLLSKNRIIGGVLSTEYMYRGESLALRLRALGFERVEGESEWDLRKRVFPQLHAKYPNQAWEFLLGRSIVEWDMVDYHGYYSYFAASWDPEKEEYRQKTYDPKEVVMGFVSDPILLREERNRNYAKE